MGDGRLGRLCGDSNIGYAQLAAHEGIENLDARSVAKDLEEVCKVVEQLLVGKVFGRAVAARGASYPLGPLMSSEGCSFMTTSFHMNMRSYFLVLII